MFFACSRITDQQINLRTHRYLVSVSEQLKALVDRCLSVGPPATADSAVMKSRFSRKPLLHIAHANTMAAIFWPRNSLVIPFRDITILEIALAHLLSKWLSFT